MRLLEDYQVSERKEVGETFLESKLILNVFLILLKQNHISFLADRFGQETSSEMVFLQRYGLTAPASRAPSRAGWKERLQHHGQRPRPGRRRERAKGRKLIVLTRKGVFVPGQRWLG